MRVGLRAERRALREARRRALRVALAASWALAPWSGKAESSATEAIQDTGDILQIVLPASAAAGSLAMRDWDGFAQFGGSFGTTMATVGIVKGLQTKFRPNSSNAESYPSGHTAAAFSGAAFLERRYGPWVGVPAYAVAAFTGVSRVVGQKHFMDDVIAGANVAMISNWAWVAPFSERFHVTPVTVGDGVGIGVGIPLGGEARRLRPTEDAPLYRPIRNWITGARRASPDHGDWAVEGDLGAYDQERPDPGARYRFGAQWGVVWQGENVVQVPRSGGTYIDLANIDGDANPTTTAFADFALFLSDAHELGVEFSAWEAQEDVFADVGVSFDGELFDAGTRVLST
jgi:hypothetical protein